tara:strand:- start:415 stop:633 length:219 start_codon:yes stop_codon:yes gene_type:complete
MIAHQKRSFVRQVSAHSKALVAESTNAAPGEKQTVVESTNSGLIERYFGLHARRLPSILRVFGDRSKACLVA